MKELQVHILERLDKIQEVVGHVRESQIRMEVDVAEHIRRTNLLEEEVKSIKKTHFWLSLPIELTKKILNWVKFLR